MIRFTFRQSTEIILNEVEAVRDNAGLMAIKFLMSYGVAEIKLAGFDGYSHDSKVCYNIRVNMLCYLSGMKGCLVVPGHLICHKYQI